MPIYSIQKIREIIAPIAEEYGVSGVSFFDPHKVKVLDEDREIGLLVDRGEAIGWKYYGFMQEVTDALCLKSCMIPADSPAGKQILETAELFPLYDQNGSHQQTMQTMGM